MNSSIQIDIENIQRRQQQICEATLALKQHFCGLDEIIDRVAKSIEIWYIMPELLTRPLIVNLWGMTGVGKTDLVRRLVKLLNFNDRYCEIELTNDGCPAHPFHDNISSILSSSTLHPEEPGILLLDEIQRFRTIAESNEEIHNYKFQDVWTLLGDGRLPNNIDSDYLLNMVFASKLDTLRPKQKKRKQQSAGRRRAPIPNFGDSITEDDEDNVPSFYTLKRFKEVLRLQEPLEKIATWSHEKKMEVVFKKMEDKSVYDHVDYTKLLIFVSGNIDEAYSFAKRTEEADIDADFFYEQSLQINILDIKAALKKRFRPEQISRLGNTHIIYPALSRSSYERIIERRIERIILDVKKRWKIQMDVDKSMNVLIYNNGVFPVQGTRPVLSTIADAFENCLPSFILQALMQKSNHIQIGVVDGAIVGTIEGKIHALPFVGSLDKLREEGRHKIDQRIKTAVHESGHGLVYGLLFKTAPLHIAANAIASTMEGYIGCHNLSESQEMLNNKIATCLAGAVAEELVFGVDWRTGGNEHDLRQATEIAANMVRNYGMKNVNSIGASTQFNGRIGSEYLETGIYTMVSLKETDVQISKILEEASKIASRAIRDNYGLFVGLIEKTFIREMLSPDEVRELFAKFGIKIEVKQPRETLIHDYLQKFESFKKKMNVDGDKLQLAVPQVLIKH
jgi:hypothetical protein